MAWTAEYTREYMRAWYHANKERVRKQRRAWAEKNRVELNAYKKAWQVAHPESRAATQARRKEIDRELKRAARHKYRTHYIWNNIRKRAHATGRPFTLTREQVTYMLMNTHVCPALGIELAYATGQANDNSPSIDCFYPELGYVPGNVYVISRRANMIKHNASVGEIRAVLTWMENTTVIINASKE